MQMSPSIFDKRPPFVRFEERELGIDPTQSEAAGRPIPRVVVMACITPHGSKDVVEKIAEEWLAQIRAKALKGEYPLEWSNFFAESFKEYQKGNELPREGTPIATWQLITREASSRLRGLGISTVEDLAEMPDSNLGTIGMDGRYWRDQAKGWINEGKDKGINARAIANANAEISELKAQLERSNAKIEKLAKRLEKRAEQDEAA